MGYLNAPPRVIDMGTHHFAEFALAASVIFFVATLFWNSRSKAIPGIPVERDPKWSKGKDQVSTTGDVFGLVKAGLAKGRPFQVVLSTGPRVMLPPKFMNEIRNDRRFDIDTATKHLFFVEWPAFNTFSAFADGHVMRNMVTKKLTTSLASVTEPVNAESIVAIEKIWPSAPEWKSSTFISDALSLTTQVTSRIFLGLPICRDPEVLRVMKDYTIELTMASSAMRQKAAWMRPFAYLFDPQVKALVRSVRSAYKIIGPELRRRQQAQAEALAKGDVMPKRLDSIQWFEEIAAEQGYRYDVVAGQLSLSFAAIHTTSLTMSYALIDIISTPGLTEDLRQEIISVVGEEGRWEKSTLYKLKLLDAVMKESQRLTPIGFLMVRRVTLEDVILSDGTAIPKGVEVNIPNIHMQQDETIYPQSVDFDERRFFKLRQQPGNESKYQFVTTSADHTAFGHGRHACPGRFFASNEIKLLLAHLLMKYDWKFKDDKKPATWTSGISRFMDPKTQLLYRSRSSEVSFN